MVFSDDQLIIQDNRDSEHSNHSELQRSMFQIKQICSSFNLKISMQKTKTMVFLKKKPLRTITVLDKSIEQTSHFRYLGYEITYYADHYVDHILAKFQSICGTTVSYTHLDVYKRQHHQ